MPTDLIRHYDLLIDEQNDPVHDPAPLRVYMDRWDGPVFLAELALDPSKSVLEIGVGTGRLAVRTAPLCREFCGIDISPKTIRIPFSTWAPGSSPYTPIRRMRSRPVSPVPVWN